MTFSATYDQFSRVIFQISVNTCDLINEKVFYPEKFQGKVLITWVDGVTPEVPHDERQG